MCCDVEWKVACGRWRGGEACERCGQLGRVWWVLVCPESEHMCEMHQSSGLHCGCATSCLFEQFARELPEHNSGPPAVSPVADPQSMRSTRIPLALTSLIRITHRMAAVVLCTGNPTDIRPRPRAEPARRLDEMKRRHK